MLLIGLPSFSWGQPEATVYKAPNCGCCKGYVRYLEENGYHVKAIDTADLDAVKRQYGVSSELAACHTSIIDGYVVEGHVPVVIIEKLLGERPDVRGISLPGMPQGSPGMTGEKAVPFAIYTLEGTPEVYTTQ